jgi:hypothetical protein
MWIMVRRGETMEPAARFGVSTRLELKMATAQQGSGKIAVLAPASSPSSIAATAALRSPLPAVRAATVDASLNGPGRDSYSVTALADITDRALHAAIARFTAGMSPASLAEAYLDWLAHLTYAPGKRTQLLHRAASAGSSVQQRSLAKMAL